jgi:radical SAM-linked protein
MTMRLRLTFSKQGPLRYTGHLDLHNLWERAARRAGLPLAYSQGFHPQPKINLASALPLGFSSRAEVMDIWLKEDSEVSRLRSDLQAALPADIQILDIQAIDERAPKLQTIVVSAEYEATLSEPVPDLEQKIAALLEAASLPRERRGKAYDLRPLIESVEAAPAEGSEKKRLVMRLAARESATGRPEEVLDALGVPIESARIERTRLLFLDSPTIRLSD